MNEKEKQVQKALGTLPEFTCNGCGKLYMIDEKFIYTDIEDGLHTVHRHLCLICATAQFVCDRLMKVRDGHWDKEKFDD